MWFHYFMTFIVIAIIAYFLYEYVRKTFFPTDEERFETSEQLVRKIDELAMLKYQLQAAKDEVEVTEELKNLEDEIEKYKNMLSELEGDDK